MRQTVGGREFLARFPSDRLLTIFASAPFTRLRLGAARKAADRSLHVAALNGAPEDPYVLARLGLHSLALQYPPDDDQGFFGSLMAKTALGRIGAMSEAGKLNENKARQLAAVLAPHSASAAARLLPDGLSKAACLVAAGQLGAAKDLTAESATREACALRAHIHAREGDFFAARKAFNEMMAIDSLSPPLDLEPSRFDVGDFKRRALLPRHGPRVSIVIPYHNAAETLEDAVLSAAAQTWQDLEILLVDDRSSDDSAKVAANLAAADSRISLLTNMREAGVYGARNTAIEAATGEYVAFLDADDWIPPEKLARQIDSLGKHGLAIANHVRIDEAGAVVAPRIFPLVRPVPITMLVRRSVLLSAGPFEEVATGADSEMLGRLEVRLGRRAIARDLAVLLVARWRTGSLSESEEGGLFGLERLAYRTSWMFRHAGLQPPKLASGHRAAQGAETLDKGPGDLR